MDKFKEGIIEFLKKSTKQEDIVLEIPPNPEMGDYAFPCFNMAKTLKKNPVEIAKELAAKFPKTTLVREIKAAGPYVNFFVNNQKFNEAIL